MHGVGNDFAVFDGRANPVRFATAEVLLIADRQMGIGCDQIIIIEPDLTGADAFMRILNADGTEAGACGNATRCVAMLLAEQTGASRLNIRTISGLLPAEMLADGLVEVDMGAPKLGWADVPLVAAMDTLHLDLAAGNLADPAACSMGNPHATFFVDDMAAVDIARIGPVLEHAALFPDRANIGFAQVETATQIRLRVWERGAGLTLACGSGACAALVNAHRRGLTGPQATMILDGGILDITWRDIDGHVLMRGPAVSAYTGNWPEKS
ncbi:MAG: diaminopimelate epimerase [Acidocella sp.]|nr:diaminopimelate epimerase [Acidocella sp.]